MVRRDAYRLYSQGCYKRPIGKAVPFQNPVLGYRDLEWNLFRIQFQQELTKVTRSGHGYLPSQPLSIFVRALKISARSK